MKDEKIGALVDGVEKEFGKGAIRELGSDSEPPVHGVISTGSLALNDALGIGGIPKGAVTEIQSSVGLTLAVQLAAEAQKAGGVVAFIDASHRLDVAYAKSVGVNVERVLVSQPDNGDQALEIVEVLTRSGAVDLVVVDSVELLASKGLQRSLRCLTAVASRTGAAIVFLRGDSLQPTSSGALKFYASVRIQTRYEHDVAIDQTVVVGSRHTARISKNKFAPPFREASFEIRRVGIDATSDLLDFAVVRGVVTVAGPTHAPDYVFGQEHLAKGRERARERLVANPDVASRIRVALAGKVAS